MHIPFTELPLSARIWIYQSSRTFSEEEERQIAQKTAYFLSQWTAHAQALQAGFLTPYHRFLIIGLNEATAGASGCSIDASVHFIQALEETYGLTLLDKMNVTFRQGAHLAYKPLAEFKKMAKSGAVSKNTIVFNNLANTKADLESHWEVPAAQSWHSRFFK